MWSASPSTEVWHLVFHDELSARYSNRNSHFTRHSAHASVHHPDSTLDLMASSAVRVLSPARCREIHACTFGESRSSSDSAVLHSRSFSRAPVFYAAHTTERRRFLLWLRGDRVAVVYPLLEPLRHAPTDCLLHSCLPGALASTEPQSHSTPAYTQPRGEPRSTARFLNRQGQHLPCGGVVRRRGGPSPCACDRAGPARLESGPESAGTRQPSGVEQRVLFHFLPRAALGARDGPGRRGGAPSLSPVPARLRRGLGAAE